MNLVIFSDFLRLLSYLFPESQRTSLQDGNISVRRIWLHSIHTGQKSPHPTASLPTSCDTPQNGTVHSKLVRTENLLLASLSFENGDLDLNSSQLFTLTSGKLFALIKAKARLHDSFLWMSSWFNDCPLCGSSWVLNLAQQWRLMKWTSHLNRLRWHDNLFLGDLSSGLAIHPLLCV